MELKEIIKQYAKARGMTFKEVAQSTHMDYNGLHDKFRRGSLTVRDLEKILDVLDKEMIFKDKEKK